MESDWRNQMFQVDGALVLDFPDINQVQNFQHQFHQRPRQRNNNPRRSFYSEEVAIFDGYSNFQDHQPQLHYRPRERNINPYPYPIRSSLYNEEVAIIDHHHHHQDLQRINRRRRRWVNSRNMHMPVLVDIDRMSYEQLLAFQERIGTIKTGLSEETISNQLKTRISQLNESEDMKGNQEGDEICIICQCEYENRDKIGMLNCGHEYHENCIKKWLMEKNICPICKRPALEDQRNRHEL